jgi:hypothetical protein
LKTWNCALSGFQASKISKKWATFLSLLALLLWYLFDPKHQTDSIDISEIRANLERELTVLNNSKSSSGTGLFQIEKPPFKLSFYQNITGYYHGHLYTADEEQGLFELHLQSSFASPHQHFLTGELKVRLPNETLEHRVMGVHYPVSGASLLSTYQKGWDPTPSSILKLVPPEDYLEVRELLTNATQRLVRELEKESKEDKKTKRTFPRPRYVSHCVFDAHMQLKQVGYTLTEMELLEHELLHKQGQSTITPPYQYARVHIKSSNCGYEWNAENVVGIVASVYEEKVLEAIFFFAMISILELYLTIYQMEIAQSPMSRTKLSPDTWVMLAFIDLFQTIVFISFAFQKKSDPMQTGILVLAFFKFILFSMFEIPFVFSVFFAHSRTTNNDSLAQFKYSILLLAIVNVALIMHIQYRESLVLVTLFSHSFWIPQIFQNVLRNHSRCLRWWFILGVSFCKTAIPLYVWMCPYNVVQSELFTLSGLILLGWMVLQVWLLYVQDRLGPRYYLPQGYLPKLYDYHPVTIPASECGICFSDVAQADAQDYMVTPCNHLFHSDCLNRWFEIKLECPICKRELPLP